MMNKKEGKKKNGLIIFFILLLVAFSQSTSAQGIELSLSSAVHQGNNIAEVFALDGIYYDADMNGNNKFYLNFSKNMTNGAVLKIYARKDKGIIVGIYDLSDSSGSAPLGNFTVVSSAGAWYNTTLNIPSPTNKLWLGEGNESGNHPREQIDYIFAETPDIVRPNFSNYAESPANNTDYSPANVYYFNVTIKDNVEIENAGISFNNINYSVSNISSVYKFSISNLAAGVYQYYWWARDLSANYNISEIKHYTISKAPQLAVLTINESSLINYGKLINVTCNGQLYKNNINTTSEIGLGVLLGTGEYNYSCQLHENQNYTYSDNNSTFVVNKADNSLTLLTSSGWTYNYGTESTFSCSALNNIPNLYIDNTPVENPKTIVLSAGSHTIKCNISESQNYTSETSQGVLTINKVNSQSSLVFDKTSPQIYNASISPSCSIISGIEAPNLTLNSIQINSAQSFTLGAGTWNFNCSLAESQNYTSSSNSSQFTINPATTNTNVVLNPLIIVDYGNETNFSCSNSAGFETALYINGINKDYEKSLNILRAAGIYNINCSFSGNENYSASSEQINYTINKALGDVKLYLNQQENNITIDYPQQYSLSASTLFGNLITYKDGIDVSSNNGLNTTPERIAKIYNITAVSSGDENHSSLSLTRWLNVTLDILAPELQITSPQEGAVYGYNISLPLNFSVSDEHFVQCWYNINNGENISLLLPQGAGFGVSFLNCQNATFNVATDSNYILYLYANDSLGNIAVKNVTFSVFVGAPTITLSSPMGIYLNNYNVTFRYSPTDIDLASCELWGDFTGVFALNQTNSSPANGVENTFALNLRDGNYKWNIKCNDNFGHSAFNGNKSFVIDTLAPSLTLTEPSGTKSSRTSIPLQFSVQDNNLNTCSYKVWRGAANEIAATNIDCTKGSDSFNVTVDADFVLEFFVNDLAGNFAEKNLSFSVSASSGGNNNNAGQGSSAGSGSSSGGGGEIVSKKNKDSTNQAPEIEISNIEDIIMQPEEKKTLLVQVKNSGQSFLNKCKLSGLGEYASWIDSTEIKNINQGEITDYLVSLSVPSSVSQDTTIYLTISCLEKEESFPINLKIQQPSLSIEIKSIEKSSKNQILVSYTAKSTSSALKSLSFKVYAESGEKISEANEELALDTSPIEKTKSLDVSKAKQGMLKISIDSGNSTIVEEFFLYGGSITGLATFAELSPEKTYSGLIILILGITSFVIIKRILTLHKIKKLKRSVVIKNFQKR